MIKKTNENCYELTYNNCEVFPVTGKFILTIIENYMKKYNELNIKK